MRRLLAFLALLVVFPVHGQDKVLRVVPHSNLNILDPIWTTQYMARNHGYMVYDTLFGTDEKNRIQPQMVEKWTESPDHRLWTFTLRPGLAFHDGKPVTGEDVVASLERWGKRDSMGQKLMTFVERKEAPSGTAGGKHVYVERVEWNLALRDAQAQVSALSRGEIDILEQPAFESYAPLQADKGVQVVNANPLGFQYMCRFNHLHPPFN